MLRGLSNQTYSYSSCKSNYQNISFLVSAGARERKKKGQSETHMSIYDNNGIEE
jgi:hypothetical protein